MCVLKIVFNRTKKKVDVQQSSYNKEDDMDDLDFDEMNDVWDEKDF